MRLENGFYIPQGKNGKRQLCYKLENCYLNKNNRVTWAIPYEIPIGQNTLLGNQMQHIHLFFVSIQH